MGIEIGGLFALLILIADVWAIINVITSGSSKLAKLVWVLAIVALPVLGLLVWLVTGPRAASQAA